MRSAGSAVLRSRWLLGWFAVLRLDMHIGQEQGAGCASPGGHPRRLFPDGGDDGAECCAGRTSHGTVDNGSEFFSKEMDSWAYRAGVKLDFMRPGKLVENAFIESFNGRLRDEGLNAELFLSIDDARRKLLEWKLDYNERRPHSSIGNLTPTEFAERCQETMTA